MSWLFWGSFRFSREVGGDGRDDWGPGSCQRKFLIWAWKDERAGKLVPESNLPVSCCPAPQDGALLDSASLTFFQGVPSPPFPTSYGAWAWQGHCRAGEQD